MDPSLCILTSYQAGVVVAVVARPCDRSLDSSVKGEGDGLFLLLCLRVLL